MADVVNLGNIQIANAVSVVYTAGDNITISDDRVISAIVPTKTSDLVNDSGYITNDTDGLVNYTTTSELNTLLSEKADSDDVYTKTESDSRYPLSSNVYTKTESDSKYSTIPETGNKIEVSINSSTYVMTMNLKDKNNNILSTGTVDLPLESVVVSGRYDDTTKELILTLQNGNEIKISVADLVSGLQETLIAGDNIQINGNTISATDTTYSAGENVTITGTTISAKDTTYTLSGETEDDVTTITLTDSDDNTSTATVDCSKYQEELDTLNEIVDGLPRVEGEGTELSLSPTIKAPLKSTIKGNATQTTYTGKNLLSTNSFTLVKGSSRTLQINFSAPIPAGTYTISCKIKNKNGLSSTVGMSWALYDSQTEPTTNRASFTQIVSDTASPYSSTKTTDGESTHLYVFLNNTLDDTATITLEEVMLESGGTPTSYEPYTGGVASPNPDYPQKVKVVTGDNTVQVCGKNLFSGYTKGSRLSPTDGSEYSSATGAVSDYIPVDMSNSAKYVVSGLLNTLFNFVGAYNQNKEFLGRTDANNPSTRSLTSTSFNNGSPTATGEIKYIRITAYENPNVTGKIDDIDNAQTMVEKSNTATTYEPYIGASYPINLGVVNLFNKNGDFTYGNTNYKTSLNEQGQIVTTSNYGVSKSAGQLFTVKANTDYTLSGIIISTASSRANNVYLQVNTTSGTEVWHQTIASSVVKPYNFAYTFNSGNNTQVWLSLNGYADSGDATVVFENLQIEEGTTASSYSPYGVVPVELCKIGDYQDYFYKENGKWYKKMCVRHLSLPIASMNNGVNYPGWKNLEVLKNDFPSANASLIGVTDYYASITKNDNGLIRINTTTVGVLYLSRTIIDLSESDWKATYPNLVLELYYGLTTPVVEQITNSTLISQLDAIASASSYKTQTNISSMYNTDNAQMIISASALYDLSALINA